MTAAYLIRLACVCLASFFLLHIALELIISLGAPIATRAAARMSPRCAMRLLLTLRFFPPGFALLTILVVCVPSYLRFEPRGVAEPVGFVCMAIVISQAAIWIACLIRGARAIQDSRLRIAGWCGRAHALAGSRVPALIFEGSGPCLALAGLLRPRIMVSSRVLSCLSAEQLELALRHEEAHRTSRDNLKRLLLLLAPRILPCISGLKSLDRAWTRFAEYAADDGASKEDPRSRILLAETLLRLARLGNHPDLPVLAMPLLAESSDLAIRIERLLYRRDEQTDQGRTAPFAAAGAIGLCSAAAALCLQPPALLSVHTVLELLIH